MNADQQNQSCSILFVSEDLEWIHAYLKALKQTFLVKDVIAETDWKLEAALDDLTPDLVIFSPGEQFGDIARLRKAMSARHLDAPVLTVLTSDGRFDEVIKKGSNFAVPRADLLTAVKYTQQILRYEGGAHQYEALESQLQSLSVLYDTLYKDLPDPVCYVQDGLFMDANQAFLDAFGFKSLDDLLEMTLMNLVAPRSEKELKAQLRTVMSKGVVPTQSIQMQTKDGEKKEFVCGANKVKYQGEPAVQLHLRNPNAGGGMGGGADETTGLPAFSVLKQSIDAQKQSDGATLGYWAFLWLENYREIWQKDGYDKAEIMMKAVAGGVAKYLPASTVAARYCDDALILWIQGGHDSTYVRLEKMLAQLSESVPDNIGRLVHPSLYVGMEAILSDSTYTSLLSSSFRGVRSLSLAQSSERITETGANVISRKDERRLAILQKVLDEGRFKVRYQPISALEADGVQRFAAKLEVETNEDEDVELDSLLALAERYNYSQKLDELKISTFLQDILSSDGKQKTVHLYIPLSAQSLSSADFGQWVISQFKQTGIPINHMIFEISLDTANNAFSGAMSFAEFVRKQGASIALTEIARLDDDVNELLTRLKPETIKLDMREIDTFEDDEEERFMTAVKSYAEEHGVMIIVDHMESPAQLSRVWPYDLQFLQGDGLLPPMDNFDFDFNEPLF